jgi:sulfopropanediol 3-dehydrogenase
MYIPGGRYPHIAAASMQSVTASAAGVNSIVACTPTRADILDADGNRQPHPYVVSALHLGGVTDICAVGGV